MGNHIRGGSNVTPYFCTRVLHFMIVEIQTLLTPQNPEHLDFPKTKI